VDLIEFIKENFADRDTTTDIVLEWFCDDVGFVEEYCFEGSPSAFVEKYTQDYDCLDEISIFDVHELRVCNKDMRTRVYISIVKYQEREKEV